MESKPLDFKALVQFLLGKKLGPQNEDVGASEEVIAVVRKEGEMVKPADAQCRAIVVDEEGEESRCENEIVVNTQTGDWMIWCSTHQAEEEAARESGGERLQRVE